MRERKSRATTRRTRKSDVPKITNRSARTKVRKPRKSSVERTPRDGWDDKYKQDVEPEPIKKKNGNPLVRWVNTNVDNVRLGLGILIFLCSLLILNNNLNIKQAYLISTQSFSNVLQMGKLDADLTRTAREYVVTGDDKYKKQYDEHLLVRNGNKVDRHGLKKSYDERFRDIPNSIVPEADKKKLHDSLSASDFLALKEVDAFKLVEDDNFEDAKKLVFGDEYDRQKDLIIEPLLEFTDNMQEDIGNRIVKKVKFSYIYVIVLCLANLILIILINDRLDLSITDEE